MVRSCRTLQFTAVSFLVTHASRSEKSRPVAQFPRPRIVVGRLEFWLRGHATALICYFPCSAGAQIEGRNPLGQSPLPPSHGGNWGSNPLRDSKEINRLLTLWRQRGRPYGKYTASVTPDESGQDGIILRPQRGQDRRAQRAANSDSTSADIATPGGALRSQDAGE